MGARLVYRWHGFRFVLKSELVISADMASAELDELGIAVFRVARFDGPECHVYPYFDLFMIHVFQVP